MLVDSHCHLDFDDFAGELDQVVERAERAGVARMVTICTRPSRLEATLAIAERFDSVYAAVGVHPHEADQEGDRTADALVALAEHPKIVGIGETGLDYHYDHSARHRQRDSFARHIEAARRTGLPLIVHTREADTDTAAILREGAAGDHLPPLTGLLHCFSSGRELAEAAVALGLHISLSGILTFRAADELRNVVRDLPLDRLLVETDSPYLAPVPKRGKRNEPAFVVHTADRLAALKDIAPEEVARSTTEAFFRLFSKVPPPGRMAA